MSAYTPRRAAVVEETEFLLSTGTSAHHIAHRLSLKPASLERTLYRAGRPDLARKMGGRR